MNCIVIGDMGKGTDDQLKVAKGMKKLYKKGVGKLFGPGTPVQNTIDYITEWVETYRR